MRKSGAGTVGGMTLIEILVVLLIIMVLVGMLLPALGFLRQTARKTEARQTVAELAAVLEVYRREDPRRRYPAERPDQALGDELLVSLDDRRLWSRGQRKCDASGRLLDPWNKPYRYSLARPTPAQGAAHLTTWNWDPEAGREARWGRRRDPVSGANVEGPLPYPYLWSLGRGGTVDDASRWIFNPDGG